jgi:hypothetical protein
MLKKYNKCIEDCTTTIGIDCSFVKAYKRRARSNLMLGNIYQAQSDLENAIKLAPDDATLQ